MSTVYVIGAGASFGESLEKRYPEATPHQPPLTRGFFRTTLLHAIDYGDVEESLKDLIAYVRKTRLWDEPFGTSRWESLDLEELLTEIEISREFQNAESDLGVRMTLLRNSLVRHIRRVLGLCTEGARGRHYHSLVNALANDDSIITSNWDLLLDREFLDQGRVCRQYANFFHRIRLDQQENLLAPYIRGNGLFLKLHGSLNWFRCVNLKCPSGGMLFSSHPLADNALNAAGEDAACWYCGSSWNPIIIPPLLKKPITDDSIIRSIWGLAKETLETASRVVVIGFSAPPTDFYIYWLLRSTIGTREDIEVHVINPSNNPQNDEYPLFKQRMDSIFLRGYNSSRLYFSEAERLWT